MEIFFCILVLSVPVCGFIMLLLTLIGYETNGVKIKFKSFKKFYEINPDRWDLCYGYVRCNTGKMFIYEDFHFGFIDFIKYKLWYKMLERNQNKRREAESISRMITAVKQDIANTECIAKQEVQDAQDIFLKVIGSYITDKKFIKQYERLMKEQINK